MDDTAGEPLKRSSKPAIISFLVESMAIAGVGSELQDSVVSNNDSVALPALDAGSAAVKFSNLV